jgi:hypothetical protein
MATIKRSIAAVTTAPFVLQKTDARKSCVSLSDRRNRDMILSFLHGYLVCDCLSLNVKFLSFGLVVWYPVCTRLFNTPSLSRFALHAERSVPVTMFFLELSERSCGPTRANARLLLSLAGSICISARLIE